MIFSFLEKHKRHFFLFFFFFHILAHFDQLGEEIFYQTEGNIDAVIIGVGTGGTIAGIARKIKSKNPDIQIVGADPYGSVLSIPG
jgi:cystathionine beta-synthase